MSALAEFELLETLVKGVTVTKYSTLASLVFLLYDHVLTFEKEAFLVWRRDWTYGKILFIFNRYFGLVTLLGDTIVIFTPLLTDKLYACKHYLRWEIISSIIALVIEGAILVSRVHAVYHRDWKVTGFILFTVFGAIVGSVVLDYVGTPDTAALPFGLTGCYLSNLPAHYKYTWVLPLITETTQCGFMLYRVWNLYWDGSNSPLLTLLVRDSILYFFTAFSVLLVNCLVWTAAPQSLAEVAIGWAIAIPCAFGSRLLLNMRERYLAQAERTVGSEHDLSEPHFRPHSGDDQRSRPYFRKQRSYALTFTVDEFTISD